MTGSPRLNIFDVIKKETENLSGRSALVEGAEVLSYGELMLAVERVAQALAGEGVGPLHRVGLLSEDCIDYVVVSLAILSLSAVAVPVSPEQTPAEVATVLDRMEVEYLIAEPRLRSEGGAQSCSQAGR